MEKSLTDASICLIDDDLIYQFTAKRMIQLVKPNQKLMVFSNGKEAIDYFLEVSTDKDLFPDIIFLDINMPIMNGWDFLDAFKSISAGVDKEIIIYMISSSIDSNDKNKSRTYELVKDFIVKPINQTTMKDILETALENNQSSE